MTGMKAEAGLGKSIVTVSVNIPVMPLDALKVGISAVPDDASYCHTA